VDVHQQPAAKLAALDPLQRTRDRATTSTTMATLSLTTLTKPQELKEYTVSLASQSISWLRDYVTAIKHGAWDGLPCARPRRDLPPPKARGREPSAL